MVGSLVSSAYIRVLAFLHTLSRAHMTTDENLVLGQRADVLDMLGVTLVLGPIPFGLATVQKLGPREVAVRSDSSPLG